MSDPRRTSRAWAVLAVSLALMALVTTLTSTAGRVPARSLASHRLLSTNRPRSLGLTRLPEIRRSRPVAGAESGTSDPGRARTPQLATASQTRAAGGRAQAAAIATLSATAPSTTTTPTPGVPGATSKAEGSVAPNPTTRTSTHDNSGRSTPTAPGTTPAPGTTAAPRGRGTLDAGVPSASFEVTGGGIVTADATWSGTTALALSVTCPNGVSTSQIGTSGISVEIDDSNGGSGACSVTLAFPPGAVGDASYKVAVEPSFQAVHQPSTHLQA